VAEHRAKTIYLAKRIFFDREFVPGTRSCAIWFITVRLKAKE
jgi:hypothetical protein